MSKYYTLDRPRRDHMVHLLYVFCDSQPEDGRIYTKKTRKIKQHTTPRASISRHNEEYDQTQTSYIRDSVSIIHACVRKQRRSYTYLPQIQRRHFKTTYQIIPIQSSKNNCGSSSTFRRHRHSPLWLYRIHHHYRSNNRISIVSHGDSPQDQSSYQLYTQGYYNSRVNVLYEDWWRRYQ